MKISAPCSTPPAPDNREQITDNLAQRVNKYTMARFHEAIYGKNAFAVGKYAAWKFKSKMQWCPCGKQLPCPNHGDFPPRFWEILPDDPDYANCLERKNLPYTSPHLLMLAEKQRREEQESLNPNPNLNPNPTTPRNSAPASFSKTSSESASAPEDALPAHLGSSSISLTGSAPASPLNQSTGGA